MNDTQASGIPSLGPIPMPERFPSPKPQPLIPPPASGSTAEEQDQKMFDEFTNIGYKPQQPDALNALVTIPDSPGAIPASHPQIKSANEDFEDAPGQLEDTEMTMETAAEVDSQALEDKTDKAAENTTTGESKRARDHNDEEVEAEEYRERLVEKMSGRKF